MLVKRLTDNATVPTRSTEMAAGADLYAAEDVTLPPFGRAVIDTGLQVALPPGTVGLIWPRSGLARKHGIDVLAGVVDADYRGPVGVELINHGEAPVRLRKGDRVAQMLVQPVLLADPEEMDALPDTDRNTRGWGSTGR